MDKESSAQSSAQPSKVVAVMQTRSYSSTMIQPPQPSPQFILDHRRGIIRLATDNNIPSKTTDGLESLCLLGMPGGHVKHEELEMTNDRREICASDKKSPTQHYSQFFVLCSVA